MHSKWLGRDALNESPRCGLRSQSGQGLCPQTGQQDLCFCAAKSKWSVAERYIISNCPNYTQAKGGKQKEGNEKSGAVAPLVHWRLKRVAVHMARVAGFEPANDGVRIRCLTAWLYPNNINIINLLRRVVNSIALFYLYFNLNS